MDERDPTPEEVERIWARKWRTSPFAGGSAKPALLASLRASRAALAVQLAALGAAAAGARWPLRGLLLARYYVLTTAALAAGLYDWLRHGTPAGWDAPEGTR